MKKIQDNAIVCKRSFMKLPIYPGSIFPNPILLKVSNFISTLIAQIQPQYKLRGDTCNSLLISTSSYRKQPSYKPSFPKKPRSLKTHLQAENINKTNPIKEDLLGYTLLSGCIR